MLKTITAHLVLGTMLLTAGCGGGGGSSGNSSSNNSYSIALPVNLDASAITPVISGSITYLNGPAIAYPQVGENDNGYTRGSLLLSGIGYNIPSNDDLTATNIAAEISARNGFTATAETAALLSVPANINEYEYGDIRVNGIAIEAAQANTMAAQIADSINDRVANITASVYDNNSVLLINRFGTNIQISIGNGDIRLTVSGMRKVSDSSYVQVGSTTLDGNTIYDSATIGGNVAIQLDSISSIAVDTTLQPNSNLFADSFALTPFESNIFNPASNSTYNYRRGTNLEDNLGGNHIVEVYFVREPVNYGSGVWSMYARVDGESLIHNNSVFRHFIYFDSNGQLDSNRASSRGEVTWQPAEGSGLEPVTIQFDFTGATQQCCDFFIRPDFQ